MKRRAYAKRRDANEPEIVKALEAIGASVIRLDVVDLLVGYRGITHLIEVKTEQGKLTQAQIELLEGWKGGPVSIVTSAEAALDVVTR